MGNSKGQASDKASPYIMFVIPCIVFRVCHVVDAQSITCIYDYHSACTCPMHFCALTIAAGEYIYHLSMGAYPVAQQACCCMQHSVRASSLLHLQIFSFFFLTCGARWWRQRLPSTHDKICALVWNERSLLHSRIRRYTLANLSLTAWHGTLSWTFSAFADSRPASLQPRVGQ